MRIADSVSAYSSFAGLSSRHVGTIPPFSQALEARSRDLMPVQIPSSLSSSLWVSKEGARPTQRQESPGVSEVLRLSTMTLDKWIRAQILQERNLTEESLAALPAAQQEAVEREIAEKIKQALTGGSDQDAPDKAAANTQPAGDRIRTSSQETRLT
ncbi:hypothetical protein IFT84_01590 [Rhizobium sp. CFBP 8762]|uniref:hypothetical protein n=1 Tax=Rhizobium sp. CFBP 8762 TaxID=2775279 RepID=UPI0017817173|nr:hypothetical protein [Rhizobium sp. CFBP 8762]MBD8553210.1 hypothetical protein [Rhizobium sp. CFBP 8762]